MVWKQIFLLSMGLTCVSMLVFGGCTEYGIFKDQSSGEEYDLDSHKDCCKCMQLFWGTNRPEHLEYGGIFLRKPFEIEVQQGRGAKRTIPQGNYQQKHPQKEGRQSQLVCSMAIQPKFTFCFPSKVGEMRCTQGKVAAASTWQ